MDYRVWCSTPRLLLLHVRTAGAAPLRFICGPLSATSSPNMHKSGPMTPRGPTGDQVGCHRVRRHHDTRPGPDTADADAIVGGSTGSDQLCRPTGSHSSALWLPGGHASNCRCCRRRTPRPSPVRRCRRLRSQHGFVRAPIPIEPTITAPTVIVVPESTHYPHGTVSRSGGHNLSRPDAARIDLVSTTATVCRCRSPPGRAELTRIAGTRGHPIRGAKTRAGLTCPRPCFACGQRTD